MAKYFTSRLIYFHKPEESEIKPESEISSHIILTRVISGLFHTRYLHCVVNTRGLVTHSCKGLCTTPANIFAAALTQLSSYKRGR